MKTVTLGLYPSFCCLAGECPSTCCVGWKILVDFKDYQRFRQVQPLWLREDILSNIQQRDGRYYFRNQDNGRCAMLDEDGLCRIQRNTEERTLCNTCRKYPRLMGKVDETLYLSMAASCPVVSRYLVCDTVQWFENGEETGREGESAVRQRVSAGGLSVVKEEWELYRDNQRIAIELSGGEPDSGLLYGCFEKMADAVLDIILQYQEGLELLAFFEVLEQDVSHRTEEFLKENAYLWQRLVKNYLEYRLLSRKIVFSEQTSPERVRQTLGELFLLRTLAFCRYSTVQSLGDKDWEELLGLVYRFCVHGKKVSGAFRMQLSDFFQKEYLWNYVLL